jgi:hypothetical protein
VIFTPLDWFKPRVITVTAEDDDVWDGHGASFLKYSNLLEKDCEQYITYQSVSADARYHNIGIGQNEFNAPSSLYVVAQALKVTLVDNDGGCNSEYTCGDGTCQTAPVTTTSVLFETTYRTASRPRMCACSADKGGHDCSKECNHGNCVFQRLEVLLNVEPCRPNDQDVCEHSLFVEEDFAKAVSAFLRVDGDGGDLYVRHTEPHVCMFSTKATCRLVNFDITCSATLCDPFSVGQFLLRKAYDDALLVRGYDVAYAANANPKEPDPVVAQGVWAAMGLSMVSLFLVTLKICLWGRVRAKIRGALSTRKKHHKVAAVANSAAVGSMPHSEQRNLLGEKVDGQDEIEHHES